MSNVKSLTRSDLGRSKFGDPNVGTEASHILSFEVFNALYALFKGEDYNEFLENYMIIQINDNNNIKIKSIEGYQKDCHLDQLIINAINNNNNNGDGNNCKQLTNIKASKRVLKIWKSVQGMMLPFELKEVIRSELNKIKDVDGKVIVNVDADLGGYLQ
ncbi:hypothetical protein ABK040_005047 [Willaertia magna]